MNKRYRFNPRTLFGAALIAPHAFAFKDDPDVDDDGAGIDPDGGGSKQPAPHADPGPEPQFTQADIDRIVQQRVQREREASERRMLEQLGYESVEDARKAAEERKKAREAKLLEEKKFAEVLQERDSELEKLRTELETERSRRVGETLTRRVLQAATRAGAVSPEQVATLTRDRFRLDGEGNVQVVNANGEIMTDGRGNELSVDVYLDQWLEQNPHYQKAASGRGSNTAGGGGEPRNSGFNPKLKSDLNHLRENRDEILEGMRSGKYKG